MNKHTLFTVASFLFCTQVSGDTPDGIYHKGWIDFNKNGKMDLYENPKAPLEERVQDLLSQMTLEEKSCQMATLYGSGRVLKDALPQDNWKTEVWKDGIGNIDEEHNGLGTFKSEYSFPYTKHVDAKHAIQRWFVEETRLGIPVDFTNEGIRGLCHDRATYFPAQCGQGATWNKELIARIGEVEAKEAVALGYTNIYSPILDIAQDPRWGRCVETYGEMRTLYIEPFRMAFQEAGALGVMSSYNDYDGEPITGSYHFLTEILRQEWGFKGYVVSDSEAVEFISSKHKVANTYEDGIAQAVNAGLNIRTHFTPPADFILPLRKAVADGKISQETLDKRVAEILRVKFWLGLFDNPYRGNGKQAEQIVHSKEHQAVSLEAARQSLVLLKILFPTRRIAH